MLKRQNANFVAKFGREPGAGDPVFFEPTADEPKPMDANWVQAQTVEVMERADIHPALIHAYKKTGRIVSEENRRYLTKADLREWQDAIDEWYAAHPGA
jgi:hypothetical protein